VFVYSKQLGYAREVGEKSGIAAISSEAERTFIMYFAPYTVTPPGTVFSRDRPCHEFSGRPEGRDTAMSPSSDTGGTTGIRWRQSERSRDLAVEQL
jgi:hypothetical protein